MSSFKPSPLAVADRFALQQALEDHGGLESFAAHASVCCATVSRALSGRPLHTSTRRALLGAIGAPADATRATAVKAAQR